MKEIPYKQWLVDEAVRVGAKPETVRRRLERGKYPGLKVRRVNSRVIFVQVP